jgi:hypothetical protein
MTREEIAKSLKPLEWAYCQESCMYRASFAVGGESLEFAISPALVISAPSILVIHRNGVRIEMHTVGHKTIDSAMQEARRFIVNEVCNLFELDEQRQEKKLVS